MIRTCPLLFAAVLASALPFPLTAQMAPMQQPGSQQPGSMQPMQEPDSPAATLRLNVRTVLVDVVVTDKDNKPVPNLRKGDFEVRENGKPQAVSFFEPHQGPTAADAGSAATGQPLPPGTFTNVPAAMPSDAVNVLMMDALNTAEGDQSYVHKEMVGYLAKLPPGQRIAVFLLSERLRIVQGFTQDGAMLRAAIARLAANPSTSPLLPTIESTQAQDAAVNLILSQSAASGSSQLADSASAMQQFLGQENGFESNERASMTMDSLQQIARYLAGVPGRKNLIWFVGAFPHCLAAMTSEKALTNGGCPYDDKYKKTVDMLADARVSIYPVDARGVPTQTFYTAENAKLSLPAATGNGTSQGAFQGVIQAQQKSLNTDATQNTLNMADMDILAKATGGKASYGDNSFQTVMAADIDDGSHYYTLAYTPTDRKEDGRERAIDIKTTSGTYKLSYRHSYYEDTPKQAAAASKAPAKDPLRPLMDRGMPDFTELSYRMKVIPTQPAAGSPHAGDNAALAAPFTRYTVGFTLQNEGLSLVEGPDGVRRAAVEVALVAYSQAGKPLNWEVRSIGLAIKPEQWAAVQASGIPFHFDIDAPAGDVYLRTGIYDNATSRAGTLEIPLAAVTMAQR